VCGFCWEYARFVDAVLQVRTQGVTPALFVPPFRRVFLRDAAPGRVTQADQEPGAPLRGGNGPAEGHTRLCQQVMCVEAELTAGSEQADSYASDKQKAQSAISDTNLA